MIIADFVVAGSKRRSTEDFIEKIVCREDRVVRSALLKARCSNLHCKKPHCEGKSVKEAFRQKISQTPTSSTVSSKHN